MATYTRETLTGSTDGLPIKITPTSTPGTTIHTAHATSDDEIWLWAANTDTVDRKLTLEWGGTTSPDHTIEVTIPAESGGSLVSPGWTLTNSKVVKAFAASADKILLIGFVNRIT